MGSLGLGLCIRVSHDGANYVWVVFLYLLSGIQEDIPIVGFGSDVKREKRWQRVGALGHNADWGRRSGLTDTAGCRLCFGNVSPAMRLRPSTLTAPHHTLHFLIYKTEGTV
jgi:hypothetical protein